MPQAVIKLTLDLVVEARRGICVNGKSQGPIDLREFICGDLELAVSRPYPGTHVAPFPLSRS